MKKLLLLLLLLASAAYGEIYTWKDARGTLYYTNSLHEIPARYRSGTKLLDVATGKKSPLTGAQLAGQSGPAATPAQQSTGQQGAPQQARVQQTPAAGPPPTSPAGAGPAAGATGAQPPLSRAQRKALARQGRSAVHEEQGLGR